MSRAIHASGAKGKPDIKGIFSVAAPRIDILSAAFSFGHSYLWRKAAIAMSGIKRGDRVLDCCTGTGKLAFPIARKVGPEGSVVGVDFCEDMLDIAKKRANASSDPAIRRISFLISDIRSLGFEDGSFDAVTVAYGIRNVPELPRALREIRRVLRPGGIFTCLELMWPEAEWFQPIYRNYMFKVVPFVGRVVLGSNTPFSYMPKSVHEFYSGRELRNLMMECGFSSVVAHPMTLGIAQVFTGA